MNRLLPLLVLWPLAGAFLTLGARGRAKARRILACSFLTAECLLALPALVAAASGRELAFAWEGVAGLGLRFRLDGFRALYLLIAAYMWMMTGFFSVQYFAHAENRGRYVFFNLMTLSAVAGVFLSDDLYTAFVFFEVMSFTSYTWVAQEETPKAMKAAETYLAIAVIGGMVTLMGLFMLYHRLGSLAFSALRTAGETLPAEELFLPGILVTVGFAAKAGMFPLHVWLPKAHPVAPAPASALLSGVLTKVGIFGVLAVSCNLFLNRPGWGRILLVPGVITMFLGALLAMFSVDLKRTLACSSMSQIGFILVGISMQALLGAHNALAVRGTVLHMVNHSLIKLTLFMAAGTVYMNLHRLNLNEIRGFGRGKPLLRFAFLMGALGISGVPLWNGYLSKSLLHESILEYVAHLRAEGLSTGAYSAVEWIFVITGGMTFSYMLKLYVALFREKHPTRQPEFDGMRKGYLTPLSALALGGSALVLPLLGFFPDLGMSRIADLGQGFMNGGASAHPVAWFSGENLLGAAKSLAIGAALYGGVIRPLLMRKREGVREYVNRWPAWLDLEAWIRSRAVRRLVCDPVVRLFRLLDGLAESRPVRVWIPAAATGLMRGLDGLAESRPVRVWIPAVCTGACRLLNSLTDGLIRLSRMTVLSVKRAPERPPVGNRLTWRLGRALDALARGLNRTILRKHPMPTDYEYRLDVERQEADRVLGLIARSLSFGLLLLGIGLLAVCIYLLSR